jgi:hypothetical protein
LCCLSYLVHLFHTLVSLVFFHTFDIISYLLSVVSYLQWVYFHTFWDANSYQNYSISYLVLVFFIPWELPFHTYCSRFHTRNRFIHTQIEQFITLDRNSRRHLLSVLTVSSR